MSGYSVRVDVRTRAESRFTYVVPLAFEGALPAKPGWTTYKRQYASATNHVFSDVTPRTAQETTSASSTCP